MKGERMDHLAHAKQLLSFIFIQNLQILFPLFTQEIAFLALGEKAKKKFRLLFFLARKKVIKLKIQSGPNDTSDFTGSGWDLIRKDAMDSNSDVEKEVIDQSKKQELI